LKRNFALVGLLSLILALTPFGPGVNRAAATAGTGAITISSTGTPVNTGWTFSSGTVTTAGGAPATIAAADVVSYLDSGDVIIEATEITVAADIAGPSNTNSLTLKASGSIVVNGAVDITSQGGDLIFWSDSDVDGASHGNIRLGLPTDATRGSIVSNGGHIRFGGGSDFETGYAMGTTSTPTGKPLFGIASWGFLIDAGGGNITMRARNGEFGSVRSILFEPNASDRTELVTSDSGSISILGDASTISGTGNLWGVLFDGADLTTGSGDINIVGIGGVGTGTPTNSRGVLTGGQGVNLTSGSGDINIDDQTVTSPQSGFLLQGTNSFSTSGNLTIQADYFGNSSTSWTVSTGALSISPFTDSSFDNEPSLGNVTASNGADITFGEVGNTANMALNGASTLDGSLTVHGADVLVSGATTANTLNIYSSGATTQTSEISATSLGLHGVGSYTLTNTSNAIGTVAAGSSSSKVSALSLYDASGGLTIGQVGALEGVTATGDVLIETGAGDITLARSIATDSTASTAITVNAGKSASAGTATGGDIVVSGSPTLTTGTGAIVKMFSGTESASTGLTTLVGGSSNIYTGVDETSTLSPALVNGTKYALYRSTPTSGGSSGGSSGSSSSSDTAVTPVTPPPAVRPGTTSVDPAGPNTDPVSKPVERPSSGFEPGAPARATIGGIATRLIEVPRGPDGFSFTAGAFQFGVTMNGVEEEDVVSNTPSSPTELFVPSGQPAVVAGGGSYPGSFVQLWLPGDGTDSRELARISVRPDGTFGSDLSFDGPTSGAPVPIGPQVLQVVGYDEDGNQTVVDMTINIGQGAPAPEPNRQVGELPALSAGQSLATSGGMPQEVSVTGIPEAGNVVVEGPDWVINVNADRDNGVVETDEGQVLVRLDQSSVGTTSGSGFMAGTLASVWLFSEPTLMATVTVDDNGEFSSEFLVDARLIAPGEHTLQVQGVGNDGLLKAANLGVLVEQPVVLTSEGASSWLFWVVGVLLLALLLILFFLLARRRRSERA
jgi:hypothetical protein